MSENEPKNSDIVPVSEETKALVDNKLADEPDEIKQKMGELIELIKQRANTELQEAEEMTQESYVKAIGAAKSTFKKIEYFFAQQEKSLSG